MKHNLFSAAITMLVGLAATSNTCQAAGGNYSGGASGGIGPPIQTSLILPLPAPQTPTASNGPYLPLHDGAFAGPAVPLSPDPLVRYWWQDPRSTDDLQYYLLRPVKVFTDEPAAFVGLKSASRRHCDITVRGTGSLRFDFGVESAAWLEFDSPDMPEGGVQAGVSEFTAPAWEHCIAAPTYIGGHTYCLKLKGKFDYNGVRFGWIYVNSFDGHPWHITNVRLVCQIKPTNYKGSFSCSDPMLTKIWYTGAYTVKLNLLQNLIGAILMDRGDRVPWTGDDHIAQGAALTAFGDWDDVAQNLKITQNNYQRIPSYALYWVLSVLDYYNYTGDSALLTQYIPNVQGKLSQAGDWFQNPKPRFYGWDDRVGSGFMDANCDEACEAYRMLFIETCRQFAQAMGTLGRDDLQNQYQQTADRYAQLVQTNSDWVNRATIFSASDAINAGVPTAAQEDILYRHDFANPVERISLSSFNEYFILKAMGRMGWTDQALQTALEDWGGQINYGGTTFFECYWPSWNAILPQNGPLPANQAGYTSLCHPWSAGCTTWLTRYVAGIEPTGPGFATVDIMPHLGRLLTRVAADAPTPHGTIHWSFDARKGRAELVVPDGVTARVGIPALDRTIDAIRINGRMAWEGSYHAVPAIVGASQQGDRVYFNGIGPGRYTFNIRYSGQTPAYAPQPLVYPDPVNALGQDDKTSGNWGGVYGKDGYVLFDYDGGGTNRENLPSYIQSVTCRAGRAADFTQWAHDVKDSRALSSNGSNEGARNAAADNNHWTVLVDIRLKQPHPFRLAAYAVDFDREGRQEAVDIYNLHSLILAAPTQAVREYQEGKYVIFECHDSVRLRFDTISGSNAVVSGIFFDPDSAQQAMESTKVEGH